MNERGYRPCVLALFQRKDGLVLACQRADTRTWQFPQGGVEEGETEEQALYREMEEEIGSKDFSILKTANSHVRYDFPSKITGNMARSYCGQQQRWFLCSFNEGASFDQSKVITPEFIAFKWASPSFVIGQMISWKFEAYKQGFVELGLS